MPLNIAIDNAPIAVIVRAALRPFGLRKAARRLVGAGQLGAVRASRQAQGVAQAAAHQHTPGESVSAVAQLGALLASATLGLSPEQHKRLTAASDPVS
ncbi:hypothetical protein [Amycolatopsis tucumanensis]|uniref:Uncharacterized protein n=1 Tax=Amycolatopsis tucumanensis TaxID=401106 RepID=A0ABP7HDI8_9PSEU|nr:hypothetical protein [Amycolatopsis tucumanensis]MCF6423660.1 hypothetical protein [Amycolatopsis tucumanensis]